MITPTHEQIEAAVAWWRQTLERPKHDALGPMRNTSLAFKDAGEYRDERRERNPMELAAVMADVYGARLTDEQLDKFADHLRDVLAGRCRHTWLGFDKQERPVSPSFGVHDLSVDYEPDVVLHHCGEIAEFPQGFIWPWKTSMWLDRDCGVRVRYGYGAEIEQVKQPFAGASK